RSSADDSAGDRVAFLLLRGRHGFLVTIDAPPARVGADVGERRQRYREECERSEQAWGLHDEVPPFFMAPSRLSFTACASNAFGSFSGSAPLNMTMSATCVKSELPPLPTPTPAPTPPLPPKLNPPTPTENALERGSAPVDCPVRTK